MNSTPAGVRRRSRRGSWALDAQVGLFPRLAFGPAGDPFVGELDSERVRRIDASGRISTVAKVQHGTRSDLSGVTEVAAGAYHSLALGAGGSVVGWGWNAYGQLGDGRTVNRTRPTARPVPAGARSVSGGAGRTVAAAP